MAVRQLLTPNSTFGITAGNPTASINLDIFQSVTWAPLSPVFNTGKQRAYFEDTPAGEALSQSVFDEMTARQLPVIKNWY